MPVEILVGAAIGAAVASQNGRSWLRRGLVYGVAGAMMTFDQVATATHGVVKGVRDGVRRVTPAQSDAAAATNGHAETEPAAPAATA